MHIKIVRLQRDKLLKTGKKCTYFGSFSVALLPLSQIISPPASTIFDYGLRYSALVLILFAALTWLAAKITPQRYPRRDELCIRTAREEELEYIHNSLKKYTGTLLAPISTRIDIFRKNPDCFRIIYEIDQSRHGILIILPIRKDAWESIQAGRMIGRDITPNHIVKNFEQATALYISFAEGDDFSSKGFLLEMLRDIIKKYELPIGTRPTTAASLRLVKKLGFKKLNGDMPTLNDFCSAQFTTIDEHASRVN
ncbi:hypothetical protein ACR9YC_00590 [Parasphingorhabdus sp. DH2-15]|uniref:hypothetical protein n=1 Tax=Parasphingorhabdus sp. DH2-15 TaxID=3444112 RepID=UPI003F6830F1